MCAYTLTKFSSFVSVRDYHDEGPGTLCALEFSQGLWVSATTIVEMCGRFYGLEFFQGL